MPLAIPQASSRNHESPVARRAASLAATVAPPPTAFARQGWPPAPQIRTPDKPHPHPRHRPAPAVSSAPIPAAAPAQPAPPDAHTQHDRTPIPAQPPFAETASAKLTGRLPAAVVPTPVQTARAPAQNAPRQTNPPPPYSRPVAWGSPALPSSALSRGQNRHEPAAQPSDTHPHTDAVPAPADCQHPAADHSATARADRSPAPASAAASDESPPAAPPNPRLPATPEHNDAMPPPDDAPSHRPPPPRTPHPHPPPDAALSRLASMRICHSRSDRRSLPPATADRRQSRSGDAPRMTPTPPAPHGPPDRAAVAETPQHPPA